MNEYAGLNELTPLIIKYPFEKLLKAFFNLKLQKKILKSLGTIVAFSLGILAGFTFPGLGYFIVFLLNILFALPVNSAVISGVSMVVTMILTSSLFIYLNEKIFESYNISKYGISNTDWLFTKKDKEMLQLIISSDDESLTPEQIKKNVLDVEQRFKFLVEKIRVYKITRQIDKKNTAKYALQCLRRGELSVFLDYYEDDFLKRSKRMEHLKQGRLEPRANSTLDSISENLSDIPSSVSRNSHATRKKVVRPSLRLAETEVSSQASSEVEQEQEVSDEEQYRQMVHHLVRSLQKDREKEIQHNELTKKNLFKHNLYGKNYKIKPVATQVANKTAKYHRAN